MKEIKICHIALLFTLLLNISCSTATTGRIGVDSSILPYVERFEAYLGHTIDDLHIELVRLNKTNRGHIAGVCNISKYDTNKYFIEIDEDYWYFYGDTKREMLIFHELGHCELNKQHNDVILSNGCPKSLMSPNKFDIWCYRDNKQRYLAELFNGDGKLRESYNKE